MHRLSEWLARHPLTSVVGVLALSVAAALTCWDWKADRLALQVDPAVERLLPASGADRQVFDRARQTFGDADALLVALEFEPQVWSAENLEAIDALTQALRGLPNVRSVLSVANAPNMVTQGNEVDVSSFIEQARRDPAALAGFPKQFDANPIYRGSLVSADGRTAAFVVLLSAMDDREFQAQNYPSRIQALTRERGLTSAPAIAGSGIARTATTQALMKTLQFTVPVVFALILVLLLITFRSLRAALASGLAVALALVWTLATAVLLNIPFNLITALVPALTLIIGLSFVIYLLSTHFQAQQDDTLTTPTARLTWVIGRASPGLLLSAATTVFGLIGLLVNPLPAIRQFALLSSLGVGYAVLLVLVFLPALLRLAGATRKTPLAEERFKRWGERLAGFDIRRRSWIIGIALALVPLDLWFASRIQTGADFIETFSESNPVRQDFEHINTAFNGANLISILIETYVDDALTQPLLAREIEQLQTWLRRQPEVGQTVSYVDHLKLLNQSLNNNDPAFAVIPNSAAAIKQLLVLAGGEELTQVINGSFKTALITVRINVDGSIPISRFLTRLDEQLKQMPPPLNGQATGATVIATRAINAITSGHFISLGIATVLIWGLLSLMFTSIQAGFIALLPTLVPVSLFFGTLGLLGISLSPTTSLVACVVIGIAVDDTIQYLARFNADARALGKEEPAVKSTLANVLRPITLSTITLCIGFLVFSGSELRDQMQFGLLSAFTLALAWLMNITLTPALGSKLRIVTFWDLLRLDLGQSPQHTIPLLSGLSLREARIFALMSKLETHPMGMRIIQQGDWSKDVYVIVDGSVQVFLEKDGQRKLLSSLSRGAVMGETGYFGQRRTASAETTAPARVLRFDSQDLERMRLRYPRIAATIFRNLNRIQAERLAKTTAMLQ
ncbi:MAG: MMPL family transporter [Pseudomonadota bacterium]